MRETIMKLGNCRIGLYSEQVLNTETETEPFIEKTENNVSYKEPDYRYILKKVDKIIIPEKEPCIKWGQWWIYNSGKKEKRIRKTDDTGIAFMCCSQTGEKEYLIEYLDMVESYIGVNRFTLSFMALEQRMLEQQGVILHCSFVEYKGYGILFSAPSGTGKSTQADLWEKYRECRVINGDRALIQKQGDEFYAYGWPVCGSSQISRNTCVPIRGIIQIAQGKENCVKVEEKKIRLNQLLPEVTVNRWNAETYLKALDYIEEMLEKIPIIHYSCDISEQAVETLEDYLFSQECSSKQATDRGKLWLKRNVVF